MRDIEKKLQAVGLSEHETQVFMAVARAPRISISDLARVSGLKRTSVYEYLDTLLGHGFVQKVVVGKRIHYEAQSPQSLVAFARQREKIAEDQVQIVEEIAVYLKSFMPQNVGQTYVRTYSGKRGISEAYVSTLDTWQDVYTAFTPKHFFEFFSTTENHAFLMLLKERGIRLFNLMERSSAAEKRLSMHEYDSFVKSKLLPAEVSFSSDITASAERITLISFSTQTATTIDDPVVASIQRTLMKTLWDRL